MIDELHKVCPACGRDLPLSEFGRDRSKRNGHKSSCLNCSASRWLLRHPGSKPRGRNKNQQTQDYYAPLPAQTYKCIGGPLLTEDEGDIRCFRCGSSRSKSPNERVQGATNVGLSPVKSLRTYKNGPGSALHTTRPGALTQKGLASVSAASFSNRAQSSPARGGR